MPLSDRLAARIASLGPMRLSDYMETCLLDPEEGYYSRQQVFGAGGDFTTAPEISQMFGEMIGLCLAQTWLDQGAPRVFTLAEFGPGRGVLMADILRATNGVPGFHAALQLVLLEASPRLREVQKAALAGFAPEHIARPDDLPDAPLYLVANEFFDALPIRQFTRAGALWRESVIGLRDGHLTLGLSEAAPFPPLDHRVADTRAGDVVEICPAARAYLTPVAARIAHHGGAALLIDYGAGPSLGDTFQAMCAHQFVSPVETPGEADLTAHVDFVALAAIAQENALKCSAILPQGEVLSRLGITLRAERLAASLSGPALLAHQRALHRLTSPEEMGSLFKMLALVPKTAQLPPGFSP